MSDEKEKIRQLVNYGIEGVNEMIKDIYCMTDSEYEEAIESKEEVNIIPVVAKTWYQKLEVQIDRRERQIKQFNIQQSVNSIINSVIAFYKNPSEYREKQKLRALGIK